MLAQQIEGNIIASIFVNQPSFASFPKIDLKSEAGKSDLAVFQCNNLAPSFNFRLAEQQQTNEDLIINGVVYWGKGQSMEFLNKRCQMPTVNHL